jgi:hypothetical protein
MSLVTRNDIKCLAYGKSESQFHLVLPAASSIDDALTLASGMMNIVQGIAQQIALGEVTEGGVSSLGHAASWLAEIAFGITDGVREDLARIHADTAAKAVGDE